MPSDRLSEPQPRPSVLEIAPYVPGKSKAPEGVTVHKLSSNETPLGPSPKALDALHDAAKHLEAYPDGSATALREAIAAVHHLDAKRIVCSNGSDELLALLAQIYLQPGDEAIFTEHGFLVYRIATLAAGGTPIAVAEHEQTADVDAILAAVGERTRIVFIANPNNPTGTYLPTTEIERLHAGLPDHVLLVLDAAYAEYVRRNDYDAGVDLVMNNSNVVMTRTFSKIHGLAALRVGWMLAPEAIVDAVNRVRGPFNVNALAIAAATAAVEDRDHVDRAVHHNERWGGWLTKQLGQLGLTVTPSVGNFLLVHFPDEPGKDAESADAFLTERGYVLRRVSAYGFPNALRMTIGSEAANRGVVKALKEFFDG